MGSSSSSSKPNSVVTQVGSKGHDNSNKRDNGQPKNTNHDKKKVLQNLNKKHAANKSDLRDNNYPGGHLIAGQTDTDAPIEVDDKSSKEAKLEIDRKERQANIERHEAERKQRDGESIAKARIDNLKKQVEKRMAVLEKAYQDDFNEDLQTTVNVIEDLETTLQSLQKKYDFEVFKDKRKERDELCKQYDEKVTKKSKLVLRISELAGVQLKHNNPNIADLSDENRASRLFVKFSELYDNECTDLLEAYIDKLPRDHEENIVSHIRDCLKMCYQNCQWVAAEQRKRLACMLYKGSSVNYSTTNVELQLRVKEFQKNVAKITIQSIQSRVQTEISKTKRLQSMAEKIKPKTSVMHPKLKAFLDRAAELCWYTQIQDPPVVLDFETRANGDYRSYTKSGPQIDYIVWPVLLLHENGPVLYKGIAQFRTVDVHIGGNNDTSLSSMNKRDKNEKIGKQKQLNKTVPNSEEKPGSRTPRAEITTADSEW